MMRGRNLKAAPFAITPSIVRRVVELSDVPAKGIAHIPLLPIKLADEIKGTIPTSFPEPSARTDGHEEPARVAPVPGAPSAPAEFPNLGRPDTTILPKRAEKMPLPALQDVRTKIAVRSSKPVPRLMAEVRREQLDAAIRFLKRRGILVTPCDREAQIRKYRVTGKAEAQFLEQVIEIAASLGFEGSHAQG